MHRIVARLWQSIAAAILFALMAAAAESQVDAHQNAPGALPWAQSPLQAAQQTTSRQPDVGQKPVRPTSQLLSPARAQAAEAARLAAAEDGATFAVFAGEPQPTPAVRPKDVPARDQATMPLGNAPAAAREAARGAATAESPTPAARGSAAEDHAGIPGVRSGGNEDDEELQPIPDPTQSGPAAIEAASFKGVTPGVTPLAEVEKFWGAPKEISKRGGMLVQLYSIEPFEQVELNAIDGKVVAIVIHLAQAFPVSAVAKQLELNTIRPVLVSNELGEVLGQAYPERGVLFAFAPSEDAGKPSMKVAQIILEPINAEPFVLRAETHLDTHCRASLLDLEQALKLQPRNPRALWLYGRALAATGQYDSALTAVSDAVRFEPDNPRYRVTKAQILGQVGRLKEAIAEAQQAISIAKNRAHIQARAQCLIGDLLASGPNPDYRQAIRYHMEAIKTADTVANDRHPAIRQTAKEVLLDAHLGAAHDIAWGDWKDKETAVNRWLSRAAALAENLIKTEQGSPEYRFRVATRALAACVGLRGAIDPSDWTKQAIRTGEELINSAQDPIRKAQLRWDLGMALYDALQVYQLRGDHDTALKYGEWAIEHLEEGDKQKQSPTTSYLLGRLYFRLGAIYAIRDNNHRAAISWFEKAIPLLEKPLPREAAADLGRHGETFVSMGVSYWETGQRDKALALTERGVKLMEQAVQEGTLSENALAVPYNNLATMHRHRGAEEEAARFHEMATRVRQGQVQ